jgi:hypothetical protein
LANGRLFRAAAEGDEIGYGRVVAEAGAEFLQIRTGVMAAVVVEAVDPQRHGMLAMLAQRADMGRVWRPFLGGVGHGRRA